MALNPANELASAIQSVHIVNKPDPEYDINPSTAASKKTPVDVVSSSSTSTSTVQRQQQQYTRTEHVKQSRTYSTSSTDSLSTLSSDIVAPRPRRKTLPPLPDFRFEQSYLASIKDAKTSWQVTYITIRDQVVWPLISGMAYNMLMFGWRHWNRESKFAGRGLGARVRKWWWSVNNWKIPNRNRFENRPHGVKEAEEFFEAKVGSAQGE